MTEPATRIPPAKPLSPFRLLWVGLHNGLDVFDQELFEELFVERRFLGRPAFVISDPEGVRRVLQDNVENYSRIGQNRRIFYFGYGKGLLAADNDVWHRHRRTINPLLDYRTALSEAPRLITLAEELAGNLPEWSKGQDFDTTEIATLWTTLSAGFVFAGNDRSLDDMLLRMGTFPGKFGITDFLPLPHWLWGINRLRKNRAYPANYYPLLLEKIAERRAPGYAGEKDLIWRLATARDRAGNLFTIPELYDEILTLGSTAGTPIRPLTFVWYLLAMHPWAEARLHAELDGAFEGQTPKADALMKLPFLRNVLDETMRLYPPLPTMLRVTEEDDVVCGRKIPRGALVTVAPWVVHRHRRLWDAPELFDPDRFSPERSAARSRYTFMPFSIGPHICIGASMSMVQMMIAVAVLAQRFRFRLVPGHVVEPAAYTNLRAKNGIRVTMESRA